MFAALFMPMLLAQSPQSPLVQSERFTADQQWQAIEASPRLNCVKPAGVESGNSQEYVEGTGSAVIVGVKDGIVYAISADHVVREEKKRFDLAFFDRTSYPGTQHVLKGWKIVDRVSSPDLALPKYELGPNDPKPTVMKLAAPGQRPKVFSFNVLTVGSDEGYSARCAENVVVRKQFVRRADERPAYFWMTQSTSIKGRSGGPMFDSNMRVIGICSANRDGAGYFTHTDEIHAWLKQLGYEWFWKD